MKTARILPIVAVMALLCPALLAAGLEKYKNWPNSPQGYFLTSAERAEWKANVKTDGDAEQFVNKFLASRGDGFAAMVADRAAQADKHLSVAGRAGSLTTRGKLIILFGPPAAFTIGRHETKGNAGGTAKMSMNAGEGGGRGGGAGMGASASDMADAATRADMTSSISSDYTFTFKGAALPGTPSKDVIVVVEVNPNDGSDRIADRKSAADVATLFEAAAAASIKK